jgi:ribosomal protein S2
MKGLLLAKRLFSQTVASGKDVLFVGTKRQAKTIVEAEAQRVGMHYVSERWLGGTLTNFRTIRARLNRPRRARKALGHRPDRNLLQENEVHAPARDGQDQGNLSASARWSACRA